MQIRRGAYAVYNYLYGLQAAGQLDLIHTVRLCGAAMRREIPILTTFYRCGGDIRKPLSNIRPHIALLLRRRTRSYARDVSAELEPCLRTSAEGFSRPPSRRCYFGLTRSATMPLTSVENGLSLSFLTSFEQSQQVECLVKLLYILA
jgi:hypothetical protein